MIINIGYLIILLFCIAALLITMERARRGKVPYFRTIPAVEALEEGVQRAAETNRPVHYSTGNAGAFGLSTSSKAPGLLASMSVLGHVAELVAKYRAELIVTVFNAELVAMVDEICKTAYLKQGWPEGWSQEKGVFYFPGEGNYENAVSAFIENRRPAANFLIGSFGSESLLFSEAGHKVGSMNIGGTQRESQLPFLVAICDYVMIGEELLVSGAYLSGDPVTMGSFAGQDIMKILAIVFAILGTILATVEITTLIDFINY